MVASRFLLHIALVLALACTTSQPPSATAAPAPAPTPAPAATLEPGTAAYDVHEWGLIDYVRASTAHEVATGPGLHRVAPTPNIPSPVHAPVMGGPTSAPRKPVLYFHLRAGSAPVTVDATVELVGGSIVEHWPDGELRGGRIRWPRVELTAEPCVGLTYPDRDSSRCYGVPDHYYHAQCAALGPSEQRRSIYMPRALAKFRQGFGRLMRKESDRGCVFVLDKRILDPRHRIFLRELPLHHEVVVERARLAVGQRAGGERGGPPARCRERIDTKGEIDARQLHAIAHPVAPRRFERRQRGWRPMTS